MSENNDATADDDIPDEDYKSAEGGTPMMQSAISETEDNSSATLYDISETDVTEGLDTILPEDYPLDIDDVQVVYHTLAEDDTIEADNTTEGAKIEDEDSITAENYSPEVHGELFEDNIPKGNDTPREDVKLFEKDVPKEEDRPREYDKLFENDIPKENDTPREDNKQFEADIPIENDTPRKDDIHMVDDIPAGNDIPEVNGELVIDITQAANIPLPDITSDEEESADSTTDCIIEKSIEGSDTPREDVELFEDVIPKENDTPREDDKLFENYISKENDTLREDNKLFEADIPIENDTPRKDDIHMVDNIPAGNNIPEVNGELVIDITLAANIPLPDITSDEEESADSTTDCIIEESIEGSDTPREDVELFEDVIPKENDTPREDDTLFENYIPKENDTPREDNKLFEADIPIENDTPRKDDIQMVDDIPAGNNIPEVNGELVIDITLAANIPLPDITSDEEESADSTTDCIIEESIEGSDTPREDVELFEDVIPKENGTPREDVKLFEDDISKENDTPQEDVKLFEDDISKENDTPREDVKLFEDDISKENDTPREDVKLFEDDISKENDTPREDVKLFEDDISKENDTPQEDVKLFEDDISKENDTPREDVKLFEDDIPKENNTPREDDKLFENDIPKEKDTPREDNKLFEDDIPKENDTPRKDDIHMVDDIPAGNDIPEVNNELVIDITLAANIPLPDITSDEEESADSTTDCIIEERIEGSGFTEEISQENAPDEPALVPDAPEVTSPTINPAVDQYIPQYSNVFPVSFNYDENGVLCDSTPVQIVFPPLSADSGATTRQLDLYNIAMRRLSVMQNECQSPCAQTLYVGLPQEGLPNPQQDNSPIQPVAHLVISNQLYGFQPQQPVYYQESVPQLLQPPVSNPPVSPPTVPYSNPYTNMRHLNGFTSCPYGYNVMSSYPALCAYCFPVPQPDPHGYTFEDNWWVLRNTRPPGAFRGGRRGSLNINEYRPRPHYYQPSYQQRDQTEVKYESEKLRANYAAEIIKHIPPRDKPYVPSKPPNEVPKQDQNPVDDSTYIVQPEKLEPEIVVDDSTTIVQPEKLEPEIVVAVITTVTISATTTTVTDTNASMSSEVILETTTVVKGSHASCQTEPVKIDDKLLVECWTQTDFSAEVIKYARSYSTFIPNGQPETLVPVPTTDASTCIVEDIVTSAEATISTTKASSQATISTTKVFSQATISTTEVFSQASTSNTIVNISNVKSKKPSTQALTLTTNSSPATKVSSQVKMPSPKVSNPNLDANSSNVKGKKTSSQVSIPALDTNPPKIKARKSSSQVLAPTFGASASNIRCKKFSSQVSISTPASTTCNTKNKETSSQISILATVASTSGMNCRKSSSLVSVTTIGSSCNLKAKKSLSQTSVVASSSKVSIGNAKAVASATDISNANATSDTLATADASLEISKPMSYANMVAKKAIPKKVESKPLPVREVKKPMTRPIPKHVSKPGPVAGPLPMSVPIPLQLPKSPKSPKAGYSARKEDKRPDTPRKLKLPIILELTLNRKMDLGTLKTFFKKYMGNGMKIFEVTARSYLLVFYHGGDGKEVKRTNFTFGEIKSISEACERSQKEAENLLPTLI